MLGHFTVIFMALIAGALSQPPNACLNRPTCEGRIIPIYGEFPSDEIITERCNETIEFVKCYQNFAETCPGMSPIEFDALVDFLVELCKNDSDLRRGYRNHSSCVNGINFGSIDYGSSCRERFERASELLRPMHHTLIERRISMECFVRYVGKSCFLQRIEETCGEGARQTATSFIGRGEDIYRCSDDDADVVEALLNNTSSESSQEDYESSQEDY